MEYTIQTLNDRITQLEEELAYYNRPRRIPVKFTRKARNYYNNIPYRIEELLYLLKQEIDKARINELQTQLELE